MNATGNVVVTDHVFMPSIQVKVFDYADKIDHIRTRPFAEVFENIDSETAKELNEPHFKMDKLRKYIKFFV